jgi:transcriptional regulator with XRE-family HTH domain|tara:strand:+ start:552 stop:782 length:231 start_codon:yes stop_codon:yes gene_type:complete
MESDMGRLNKKLDAHTIGTMLRQIRIEKGVTRQALADKTTVHNNTLRHYERGEHAQMDAFCEVAAALGYEIELIKI